MNIAKAGKFNITSKYQEYITDLEQVLKPSTKKKIAIMRDIDLHDYFFTPNNWFENEIEAKGFIISLLVKKSLRSK